MRPYFTDKLDMKSYLFFLTLGLGLVSCYPMNYSLNQGAQSPYNEGNPYYIPGSFVHSTNSAHLFTPTNVPREPESRINPLPYDLEIDTLATLTCDGPAGADYFRIKAGAFHNGGLQLSKEFKQVYGITSQSSPQNIVNIFNQPQILKQARARFSLQGVDTPLPTYSSFSDDGDASGIQGSFFNRFDDPTLLKALSEQKRFSGRYFNVSLNLPGLNYTYLPNHQNFYFLLTYNRNPGVPTAISQGNIAFGRKYSLFFQDARKANYMSRIEERKLRTNSIADGSWYCPPDLQIPVLRSKDRGSNPFNRWKALETFHQDNAKFFETFLNRLFTANRERCSFNADPPSLDCEVDPTDFPTEERSIKKTNAEGNTIIEKKYYILDEAHCIIDNQATERQIQYFDYLFSEDWPFETGKISGTNDTCIVFDKFPANCYEYIGQEPRQYRIEFNESAKCNRSHEITFHDPKNHQLYKVCPAYLSVCFKTK